MEKLANPGDMIVQMLAANCDCVPEDVEAPCAFCQALGWFQENSRTGPTIEANAGSSEANAGAGDLVRAIVGVAVDQLADELEENARRIDTVVRLVEARCMAVDGPVTPTLREMTEEELREIWLAADRIRKVSIRRADRP